MFGKIVRDAAFCCLSLFILTSYVYAEESSLALFTSDELIDVASAASSLSMLAGPTSVTIGCCYKKAVTVDGELVIQEFEAAVTAHGNSGAEALTNAEAECATMPASNPNGKQCIKKKADSNQSGDENPRKEG